MHVKWFCAHTKLCVHKTVAVRANLHCLIYDLLIVMGFSLHILPSGISKKISGKDMLNTKGLVALTEYQVG